MEEKFISNNEKEHREILEYHKKWYKKWWGVMILSSLFLIMIFLTASTIFIVRQVSLYQENGFMGENSQNIKIYSLEELEVDKNPSFGARNPRITIVEFSDFACPNCKSFYEKIKRIRTKYYTDIKIIHKDFPITTTYSQDLALAARCSNDQGLFWKVHDSFYENQNITSKEEIYSHLVNIGVDGKKLIECLDQNKYLIQIQNDISSGIKLGVNGTPTWFINGYRADGDMPEDMLNGIIEDILFN